MLLNAKHLEGKGLEISLTRSIQCVRLSRPDDIRSLRSVNFSSTTCEALRVRTLQSDPGVFQHQSLCASRRA